MKQNQFEQGFLIVILAALALVALAKAFHLY
jgi:hypothetical protein